LSRTLVVGGGLSGLVHAFALARRGEDVRVLEAGERPGGAVRTERREGFLLELGPNTVRPTPELWGLVRELGLEPEALLADPRLPRFVRFRGRLHALAPGPGFLATRLLSPAGKLRALAEPLVPRGGGPDETVRDFFARRAGREVAERLVAPFVSGIWAGDAGALSAAEAFPALKRWETEHGSLLRGAIASRRRSPAAEPQPRGLLSFREGLETLPRALAAALGDRLSRRARVQSLARTTDGRWRVESETGVFQAERAVLATSASDAARLIEPLDPGAARALSGMPLPPLVVAHLAFPGGAFPAPLAGFGHLVVPTPGARVLGAIWSSALFPARAPAGETLVTVFLGGARDPAAIDLSDEALLEIASRELSEALGARKPARLILATRHPRSIPQYDLGHRARIESVEQAEARIPNLKILGNFRGGVSVGDVVRSALAVAS